MNTTLSIDLLLYGVVLIGLGILARHLAPDDANTVLFTGIAGGAVTLFWGVLGLRGYRRQRWLTVTLAVLVAVLLAEAVRVLAVLKAGVESATPVAMILVVLLVFGVGQLVNLARAGRDERVEAGKRDLKK